MKKYLIILLPLILLCSCEEKTSQSVKEKLEVKCKDIDNYNLIEIQISELMLKEPENFSYDGIYYFYQKDNNYLKFREKRGGYEVAILSNGEFELKSNGLLYKVIRWWRTYHLKTICIFN